MNAPDVFVFTGLKVTFEAEYFYRGMPRWNLGWPTPNYAGAFLAAVLPYIWFFESWFVRVKGGRILFAALFFLEGLIYFAICKTYSRGALLAVSIAIFLHWVYAYFTRRRVEQRGPRNVIRPWLNGAGAVATLRIIVLGVLLYQTGLGARVSATSLTTDPSVGNRWEFWKTSTEMMVDAPFVGWGTGESGRVYMNWYQRVNRKEGFITPVNSFLQIGVEHGLIALTFWIFISVTCFANGILLARKQITTLDEQLYYSASTVILVWSITNFFSSLWQSLTLWILPALAVTVILWGSRKGMSKYSLRLPAIFGAVASTVSIVGIIVIGLIFRKERNLRPSPGNAGSVVLQVTEKSQAGQHLLIGLDETVLGAFPGKEIRRWLSHCKSVSTVEIIPLNRVWERRLEYDDVILFGNQAARFDAINGTAKIWLVHPSGTPPSTRLKPSYVKLILPDTDQTGDGNGWSQWAATNNVEVKVSVDCGSDIRPTWPANMPLW